ncbi:lactonase family protein [Pseudarthrobacter raffinosi]|uniref:lactonase family protein n=1 Tax=Pseudarthrobacter raffinosi TaxID=2953651 RepID=UPI00208EFE74|nr:beta-propeller fold lactonase family protein [Pseudarthrobacter sp. MDT3-9]MCO4253258.1 lactonase family protein [Pseudarthrobacter sp. MDT3-9]
MNPTTKETTTLWIGTYPDNAPAGSGEGIWHVNLDLRTGELSGQHLAITTPAPSFLAQHPNGHALYAVNETEVGEVSAFAISASHDGPPTLVPYGPQPTQPTNGSYPCHIVARHDSLWIANYGNGTFTSIPLNQHAEMNGAPQSFTHHGQGPNRTRQEGSHAHFVDEVDGTAWVTDLGTDEIRRYRLFPDHLEPDGIAATLPRGSGPRHFVTYTTGIITVTELDCALHVLNRDTDGSFRVTATFPATKVDAGNPLNLPSHIARNEDGSRVYTAIRGTDTLSVFAVAHNDGLLTTEPLAEFPTGGSWPRHFAVIPSADNHADFIITANQYSSNLTVLRIDRKTGAGQLLDSIEIPAPACVLHSSRG